MLQRAYIWLSLSPNLDALLVGHLHYIREKFIRGLYKGPENQKWVNFLTALFSPI